MTGIQQMLLGSEGRFALLPASITLLDVEFTPSTATASFALNSSGTYTCIADTINPGNGTWLKGTGTGSNYEARVTVITGAFTTGTVGSWISLGTNRLWTLDLATSGIDSVASTVEIRDAVSGVIFTSCALDLTVELST